MDPHKHLTDLRATVPGAIEDVSDTAWREFQALQAGLQPQPAARAPRPVVTLDIALQMVRRGNRVCPHVDHWRGLYAAMSADAPPGAPKPPPSVDGAAWGSVPPLEKRMRLRDQLEWADRHGLLEPVVRFLITLPEDAWLHF